MNKSIILIKLIVTTLMVYILASPLYPQTSTGKKVKLPSSVIKAEEEKNNSGETVSTDKNIPATNDKKSSEDKKITPSKEQTKEPLDDRKKSDKISQTLDYGIQKDRKIAINMIKEINDEQMKKDLLRKLATIVTDDSDMEIRKTAVTALGDFKSSENSEAVIKALDDTNDDVRIAACYAIGKIKIPEAKTKLIEILKKQDMTNPSNLTDAIIIALGDLNSQEIIEFAVENSKNIKNSRMLRERLILFIGKCGSAAQKDFLIELYKDNEEDMNIRSYAVKSIAKLKLKDASPSIKEVINDIDSYSFNKKKKFYDLYMQSVTALVELGDADSIPLLMNSIRSDNADVRYKAVNLIKEFDDERTIDILKYKMKYDPSGRVRKAAQKALEEKGLIEKNKEKDNIPETEEKNEDTE